MWLKLIDKNEYSIYNKYANEDGIKDADSYSARPGFSEHQTGLAFDIGSRKKKVFAESDEYNWMKENAWKYGFIERFTKQYEPITGFKSEAWHYRYVGQEIATYIYEHNNMSLEEYFVIFLDK